MSTALLILLLGAVRWTASHVVYGKDPARPIRHPYEEWRPVRDAPGYGRPVPPHGIPPRYPVFHHSKGYSYAPTKKILQQQLTDTSDTVEVFSPAPPSILGSLSVFGHATVNAREPASHVIKKSPRPQYSADYPLYERPKTSNSYQVRNHFVSPGFYQPVESPKRPNRYNDYNDPYYFESTLRPPPRESVNKVSTYSQHAQSTSLSPNSFYFEQPQPFQPSAVDNSFDKVRKPINSYHFSSPSVYSTPSPIDYRTTVNDYDQPSSSYYNTYNKKGSQNSWQRNPFGDVGIGTRRPEILVKPVVEDKEPAKDIYNEYSHLSRPFQSSQYTTTIDSQREVDTYSPYVTTFPSPVETHNVRFSDVAQPFHVNNDYRTQGAPLNKPDYVVTQDPYSQDAYPVTVTTLEVPTEPIRETKKKYKENYKPYRSDPNSRPYSKGKTKNSPDSLSHQRPHVQITSYQGFNDNVPPPFLPTPTPDANPYAPQPTLEEITTDQPEVSSNAHDSYISTIDNRYQDKNEEPTEYPVTTTAAVETTTPSPRTRATIKSRRRPTRPSQTSKTTETTRFKNHKTPTTDDDYSTTIDYYKQQQRRRKPSNKYRENSEYKRFRTTSTSTTTTTTTTTAASPSQFETTEPYEDTTTVSEAPHIDNKFIERPQEDQFNSFERYYNSFNKEGAPVEMVNSQIPERDVYSLNYADIFAEPSSSSTAWPSTTTTTTSTTTTTTTTPSPTSVTTPNVESTSSSIPARLKNKYGSNRPRFSVKDYRDRLNRSTTTSSPTSSDDETTPRPKNDIPKILSRMRPSQRQTTEAPSSQDEATPETKVRKYKPRSGPSRQFYKTSTTAQPDAADTTTTERTNTFRPSTNRYKPGSGKYYSRYRTSSLSPKEVDDSPVTTTARITIKPKGVFSAKRRPFPNKNKTEMNKEEDDSSEEVPSTANFGDTLKINDNEVVPGVFAKKMDDATTTTISSSEEKEVNVVSEAPSSSTSTSSVPDLPPSGSEAMRVADLTSSSSNDFHMASSIFKTNIVSHRRILPKISLPTDDPILPLEAFFQTRQKDK